MTPLLRRATTWAGLAACRWSTLLAAESTEVAVPKEPVLRQALTPVAAPAPVVQQSPNGLYKLSITDAGIELHGPKGTVKINDRRIQLGGPGTMQINIESGDGLRLRSGRDVQFRSGQTMTLKADGVMDVAGASMKLTGKMAARQGSQVQVGGPTGTIVIGSPRVLVC